MSGPERLTPEQRAGYFIARENLPADSMRHARLSEMVRTAMRHARRVALDEAAKVARGPECMRGPGCGNHECESRREIAASIEALKGPS